MEFTVAPAGAPLPKPASALKVPLAALRPSSCRWYKVTADGNWGLEHLEDAGSTWLVAHLPDKAIVGDYLGSLRECRAYVGSGEAQKDFEGLMHEQGKHDIPGRVAAGAAFLDVHDPEWWRADVEQAIDLDQLDMGEGDSCVLGQRCPLSTLAVFLGIKQDEIEQDERDMSYAAMAGHFGAPVRQNGTFTDEWGEDLGFQAALGPGGRRDPGDYDALTAEWSRVIRERRAAA